MDGCRKLLSYLRLLFFDNLCVHTFLLGHLTSLPGTTKMGVEWTVPQSVFWWVGH